MSQHDLTIANASGATVRADLENALKALGSSSSGGTAPSTTYAYMFWADTTADLLKQRNAANTAWIDLFKLSTGEPVQVVTKPNIVINGDGIVSQRTIGTAINDDTYAWDRWVVLSDGNGVVTPTQETSDVPTGARAAMKLTVAVANKKFGLLQIVEGKNCKQVIDDVASLSLAAKASGIANLRIAILSWDGTEDAVTSDVVSTWNAAGTDPTLVANWTYENTPANLTLSGSWASTFTAENISIDTTSTKQVAVFIWIDDTDAAVSDTLFISDVALEHSGVITGFERRDIVEEYAMCRRYYQAYNNNYFGLTNYGNLIGSNGHSTPLDVEMRAAPTATTSNITYTNSSSLAVTTEVNSFTGKVTASAVTGGCRVEYDVTLDSEL